MSVRRIAAALLAVLLAGPASREALAQNASVLRDVEIGGYAMLGLQKFVADDTFDVTLGSPLGEIFGGGVRVGVPLGGLFVDVGGWRFRGSGERVFVFDGQAFRLGIPLQVTMTPIEISGGWQFGRRANARFRPYVAGGISSYGYKEVSEFATGAENVEDRFTGYHLTGGAEFPIENWLGVAWEVNWTTVPDAIGDGGVSAAFDETNLGGASFRFKITIGR